ncbi:hypothetical protein HOY82DRAFT_214014 [Tuber indicum]|nr:hypothetical protein HOY82DRAFT_214014 [Tuber indicum]
MPTRPPRPGRKRKRQLDDPLASDSQDEDFSDQAHSPRKRTAGKGTVGKKTAAKGGRKTTATKGRRGKRNAYHSDDDDISISGDDLSLASDDEPVTLGASGRPLRSSRKTRPVNYGEESEDLEEPSPSGSSAEEEEEADGDVGKKGAKAPTKKQSIMKINYRPVVRPALPLRPLSRVQSSGAKAHSSPLREPEEAVPGLLLLGAAWLVEAPA